MGLIHFGNSEALHNGPIRNNRGQHTMIPSAESMMVTLSERLVKLVEAMDLLSRASDELRSVGCSVNTRSSLYFAAGVEQVLAHYFVGLNQSLTEKHAAGTSGNVEVDRSLYTYGRDRYGKDVGLSENFRLSLLEIDEKQDQLQAIPAILDRLDFDTIVSSYEQEVNDCESSGLSKAAEYIYDKLFSGYNSEIRFTGGYYVKPLYKSSYSYEVSRSMAELENNLDIVARHTGFVFGNNLGDIMRVRDICDLPSRTSFGRKGDPLTITVFKSSLTVSFSMAAMNAIFAFVSAHIDDEKKSGKLLEFMALAA
jgi:hypothetical protein